MVADPDATLNRFVRFVDSYGTRGLLFETLLANPKLLELLARLFDASAIFSEVVIRRPQLIEEIARDKGLGLARSKEQYLEGLSRNDEKLPPLEWVRAFRRSAVVRILVRDVLGIASEEVLELEMTSLAEACLEYCCFQLPRPDEITVLALGKFGGYELLYGADLDVVFIGRDPSAGAHLIHSMGARMSEGAVYSVDSRLRPDGEKGVLVIPLSAYREYFERRAQFWEAQALTKARTVYGPESQALDVVVSEVWRRWSARADYKEQIAKMYRRIVKELAKGEDRVYFKTGKGGLIGIKFLVQYFQMTHQIPETNTLRALDKLRSIMDADECATLAKSYRFLRRVESVLRRLSNSSISQLPADAEELRMLSIRMGFESRDDFLSTYTEFRTKAEEIIETHFDETP
jgi:[glutamine synthetase] adenylyltransferase / [glutamine synthetase]-adenylyl-L-tyrosine phosphorylase